MQQTLSLPILGFTEVFATAHGAVYQCDQEQCWYVDFAGKLARFDYRNFLKLKKAVQKIDIRSRILASGQEPHVEIIFICACDHCYILSLQEIVQLRELLAGAFTMLELHHIIYDRLHRLV